MNLEANVYDFKPLYHDFIDCDQRIHAERVFNCDRQCHLHGLYGQIWSGRNQILRQTWDEWLFCCWHQILQTVLNPRRSRFLQCENCQCCITRVNTDGQWWVPSTRHGPNFDHQVFRAYGSIFVPISKNGFIIVLTWSFNRQTIVGLIQALTLISI